MDFALHEFTHGFIDQPVTGEGGEITEFVLHQGEAEVSAARGRTGMALVLGTFVFQRVRFGLQRGEALADQVGCAHAGKVFLKGLTLTPA